MDLTILKTFLSINRGFPYHYNTVINLTIKRNVFKVNSLWYRYITIGITNCILSYCMCTWFLFKYTGVPFSITKQNWHIKISKKIKTHSVLLKALGPVSWSSTSLFIGKHVTVPVCLFVFHRLSDQGLRDRCIWGGGDVESWWP